MFRVLPFCQGSADAKFLQAIFPLEKKSVHIQ